MKKNDGLAQLRAVIKTEVIRELAEIEPQRSIHEIIVDITKAAAKGLKVIERLKQDQMPTQKSTQATESALSALEHIFTDMSRNPTKYLDGGDPNDVVKQHLSGLDDRANSLRDSAEVTPKV